MEHPEAERDVVPARVGIEAPERTIDLGALARQARGAVGGVHLAELLVPGARVRPVAYLDDEGVPVVFGGVGDSLPGGRTGLRVRSPGLGQIALIGSFRTSAHSVDEQRRLELMLTEHRGCADRFRHDTGTNAHWFDIETVLVDRRARTSQRDQHPWAIDITGGRPEVISLPAYVDAVPDLFADLAPALAAHLTDEHQDLLLALAEQIGCPDDLIAVGVRCVDAEGMGLDVIATDGSHPVPVAFPSRLTHPHQLGPALRTLAL